MQIKQKGKEYCPRVCVIGAGPSGLAAIKNLQEQAITDITAFEKNNGIGGNWIYDEENKHSSIYETTHIISSKRWSQFEDFPMPRTYPDYPSHSLVLEYFKSYAHHFDLMKYIHFNTTVLKAKQTTENRWQVTYENEQGIHEEYFDYLLVANGHHWDPLMPEYPGEYTGQLLHSHQYKAVGENIKIFTSVIFTNASQTTGGIIKHPKQ